jgi:UDP-2,4-diacetamido-2,4,6-trideoxy-beta-L-altropyranose hydrolase
MTRVLFLPDAGPEVGGGHVIRSIALADALAAQGAECAFAATPAAIKVLDVFAPHMLDRLPVGALGLPELAEEACRQAQAWFADVVVVDHYGMGAAEEQVLRTAVKRVAVIDDLADRAHRCDLLVDPSLGRKAEDYAELVPAGAVVLTGPRHALIRAEFAAARAAAQKRRGSTAPPGRVLVSLGLTDLDGITERAVDAIRPLARRLQLDVVLGAEAPSLRSLQRAIGGPKVHVDARNMPELMTEADFAVGAGGASVWERACLGLPSVLVILAENQRAQGYQMQDRGAALTVDASADDFGARLGDAFMLLRDDPAVRTRLSQRSSAMCDGQGAKLVAEAVMALARPSGRAPGPSKANPAASRSWQNF